MKKNIIIAVLAITSIFFVMYANIKASEAEKQTLMAQKNLRLAEKNAEKAKVSEKQAIEQAARAMIEQRKAEEVRKELQDCCKK